MASSSEPTFTRFGGISDTFDPPPRPSGTIHKLVYRVHRFAEQKQKRGECFETNSIPCEGYNWNLLVYPREGVITEEVGVYLALEGAVEGGEEVGASFTIKCGDCTKKATATTVSFGSGIHSFCERSYILNADNGCVDEHGTVTFEIYLDIFDEEPWSPALVQNDFGLSQLSRSEETKDVVFRVSNTDFAVHGNILEFRAPALFMTIKEKLEDGQRPISPVEIDCCDGFIFGMIVEHIYTILDYDCICPKTYTMEQHESLLVAADRFGCTEFKLHLEAKLSQFLGVNTVAPLLFLSERYTCPLLKEMAVSVYRQNPTGVMQSPSWSEVTDSPTMLLELLKAAACSPPVVDMDINKKRTNAEIAMLDVTSLRKRLEATKLDLDGSREMLVRRLTEHATEGSTQTSD